MDVRAIPQVESCLQGISFYFKQIFDRSTLKVEDNTTWLQTLKKQKPTLPPIDLD